MPNLRKFQKEFIKSSISIFLGILLFILLLLFLFIVGGVDDYVIFFIMAILFLIACSVTVIAVLIMVVILLFAFREGREELTKITGFDVHRFNREIERAPKMQKLLISSDAICYFSGLQMKIVPVGEIVWAYVEQKGGSVFVTVYTCQKEKYSIPIFIKKKYGTAEKASGYLLRLIARKRPSAVIGFEESYQQAVNNDFRQLIAKAEEKGTVDSAILEQEYIGNNYYEKDFH